jgi:hypothetical protein
VAVVGQSPQQHQKYPTSERQLGAFDRPVREHSKYVIVGELGGYAQLPHNNNILLVPLMCAFLTRMD